MASAERRLIAQIDDDVPRLHASVKLVEIECTLPGTFIEERRALGVEAFHPAVIGWERRGVLEHASHERLAREPLVQVRIPLTLLPQRRGGRLAHSRTAHRSRPMTRIDRQGIGIGLQTLHAVVELTGEFGALLVAQQIGTSHGVHEQKIPAQHGGRCGLTALEDQKTEMLGRVTGCVDGLEVDIAHRHPLAVRDVPMRVGHLEGLAAVVGGHEQRRAGPRRERASARGEVCVNVRLEDDANTNAVLA